MAKHAILLMAYGTPRSEADIEAYLTDIRRGLKPKSEAVAALKARYKRIGGRSPLLEITQAQASALEALLESKGIDSKVYVGMKHWHPYIKDAVQRIVDDGFDDVTGLVLAPHYSRISIGEYREAVEQASKSAPIKVKFIESWYDNSIFHAALAERIGQGLKQFSPSNSVHLLFTAHSLPERILEWGDPYPAQLHASCQAVSKIVGLERWSFAYQSAGKTGEKWLGPDILEALEQLSARGQKNVLVVPIGFVADHLEILYDIDIESQEFARKLGVNLKRTESLNTSPTFIAALADILLKEV